MITSTGRGEWGKSNTNENVFAALSLFFLMLLFSHFESLWFFSPREYTVHEFLFSISCRLLLSHVHFNKCWFSDCTTGMRKKVLLKKKKERLSFPSSLFYSLCSTFFYTSTVCEHKGIVCSLLFSSPREFFGPTWVHFVSLCVLYFLELLKSIMSQTCIVMKEGFNILSLTFLRRGSKKVTRKTTETIRGNLGKEGRKEVGICGISSFFSKIISAIFLPFFLKKDGE